MYFYFSLPLAVIGTVYYFQLNYEQVNKIVNNYRKTYRLNKKENTGGKRHTISKMIENIKQVGTNEFADKIL